MEENEMHGLNLYLLPGLGLSANYFDSLRFPAGCRISCIALLQPVANETLAAYAERLMRKVDEGKPFVLLGMSFGGVLAQEMASIRQPEALILLSTIRHSREFPWYFRLGHKLGLPRVIPYSLVGKAIGLLRGVAGKENQSLYDPGTVSPAYLAWSLEKMLNWNPNEVTAPCYQIHGALDRLLPCRSNKELFVIPGASHLLLPRHHQEVQKVMSSVLSGLLTKSFFPAVS